MVKSSSVWVFGGRSVSSSEKGDLGLSAEGQRGLSSPSVPPAEERESHPTHVRKVRFEPSNTEENKLPLNNGDKSAESVKSGSVGSESASQMFTLTNSRVGEENLAINKNKDADLMCLDNLVHVPVQKATKSIINDLNQTGERKKLALKKPVIFYKRKGSVSGSHKNSLETQVALNENKKRSFGRCL
ncbi:type III pantothenate kinase [Striga asiatica]|uniref:Type III pantothenate kinase n=1 Tax=Striga asiatica TaxID=4170 RepID=A0A5A7R4I3_STRAF|nr:type III pantothenate kinase [Striga asiatica]